MTTPTDCVEEQVATKIAGYLSGIAGAGKLLSGGFSRFTREGLPNSPAHLSAVLFEDDPEIADADAGWIVCWKRHVIVLFFQTPDGSTDAIAKVASNTGASVQKTITQARPWDNLIKDIQWESPLSHPYGDSHYCRELAARVLYKFREDDPFTPG
jgi:hypothetical protein